jgi:heme-degrading monooxygenase HmoA
MILELADIQIQPGREAEFDAAIQRGVREIIAHAKGFLGWQVHKGVESPQRYVLQIRWESLEDHMQGFRNSPDFTAWRELVGPFFARAPQVEHFELLGDSAN